MKNDIYKQNNTPVKGSIGDIAKQGKMSIAEAFTSCDAVAIVDVSGSMDSHDSGNKTRYERACQALKEIQAEFPGNIAVISFSDDVSFCPSGIPLYMGDGTDLLKALRFVKIADIPGMKFWVISDGEPNDRDETIEFAKSFKCPISTVYIGPDNDINSGRDFLRRLAKAAKGRAEDAFGAKDLGKTLKLLEG